MKRRRTINRTLTKGYRQYKRQTYVAHQANAVHEVVTVAFIFAMAFGVLYL